MLVFQPARQWHIKETILAFVYFFLNSFLKPLLKKKFDKDFSLAAFKLLLYFNDKRKLVHIRLTTNPFSWNHNKKFKPMFSKTLGLKKKNLGV